MIFILLLLLLLVPDLYIWYTFARGQHYLWTLLCFSPTLIILTTLVIALLMHYPMSMLKAFFYLNLLLSVPKLFFFLCSLTGRLIGLVFPVAFTVGNVLGGLASVAFFLMAVYGTIWGWKRLAVNEHELAFSDLPAAFDGYTLVQLSDFHIGTYRDAPEFVRHIVEAVNRRKPDLILFTGDLVNVKPHELDGMEEILAQLKATEGVMSILGNHDYCFYGYKSPEQAFKAKEELIQREQAMGWDVLLNEHRVIRREGDSIAIVGVENDGTPPFPHYANLPKALEGLQEGTFKVMLSHDPTHWHRAILPETDAHFTLSGHTHAMQIKIFGLSPSRFFYKEWGGLYREGSRLLHVSTGTGGNVPFRFGAWPTIDVFTLRRK